MDNTTANQPSTVVAVRGTAQTTAPVVNEFFDAHGLGRPANASDRSGRVSAVLVDGIVRGAAYACEATAVAEHAFFSGRTGTALPTLFSLEAIAVDSAHRGTGMGTRLLASIAAHCRQEFQAAALLARVDSSDQTLQEWYRQRGLTVCEPGQTLRLGTLTLPTSPGYVNAWLDLSILSHLDVTGSSAPQAQLAAAH